MKREGEREGEGGRGREGEREGEGGRERGRGREGERERERREGRRGREGWEGGVEAYHCTLFRKCNAHSANSLYSKIFCPNNKLA